MSMEDVMSDRRDREIDRQSKWRNQLGSPFTTKVVGVSFTEGYPDNLHNLAAVQERAEDAGEPLTVILVRNPDNEFDSNAIQVHVPALGEKWGFIGHLTRPIAARMAPEIDGGDKWGAEIVSVLIDPDHMDRPGISIKCARAPKEQE